MDVLVSGYSEANFESCDISQTSTPDVVQPCLSKLTSLKNATYSRCMKSTEFCLIEEIVQWWPMGKYILKHKKITNTIDPKIILHHYILY